MKHFALLLIFGIASVSGQSQTDLSKPGTKIAVQVVDSVPTTNAYNWQVAGTGSTSCYGDSCSSIYMPGGEGTTDIHGAVLRLLLPDGRIVIAGCEAKVNIGANVALLLAEVPASTVYRDCRVPQVPDVMAEFHGNNVKLFMRDPSIDGKGKEHHETYRIEGVLEPAAPTPVKPVEAPLAIPGCSSCGVVTPELKTEVKANTNKAFSSDAAAANLMYQGHAPDAQDYAQSSKCLVLTTPSGADIYVDGNRAGVSPLAFALLSHGTTPRVITVKMSGYKTVDKSIVPDGTNVPMGFNLEPDN